MVFSRAERAKDEAVEYMELQTMQTMHILQTAGASIKNSQSKHRVSLDFNMSRTPMTA
jgi:hypothetical protein